MKILAINGSPNREGSTAKLIDMVLEVCSNSGAACEHVHLEDYMIETCTRCNRCIKGGECCVDDDYLHLKAKMLEADGIVIGSPYYNGDAVEHIRVFLDRLSVSDGFYHLFEKKYILGVATSAVNDCKNIAEFCANLGSADLPGGGIVSGILYECIVTNDGVKDMDSENVIKQKVLTVSTKFINDIKNKNTPSFANKKKFPLMENMIKIKEDITGWIQHLKEAGSSKGNSENH
ncbi:MAG: flavodoxin family protein [Clostridia bacterium]|nr:flavodoxin family protein [Clostridia bacterium]